MGKLVNIAGTLNIDTGTFLPADEQQLDLARDAIEHGPGACTMSGDYSLKFFDSSAGFGTVVLQAIPFIQLCEILETLEDSAASTSESPEIPQHQIRNFQTRGLLSKVTAR
ncbi:MAG TPA: hypothetical protein VMV79_01110 [Alphaproteobacteria bacterium]|nr:hypothetical protein [Alphaproteobacteria bacterium]